MSLESVLITGANRGIGLELVRQLLDAPVPPRCVIATTRQINNNDLEVLRLKHPNKLHLLQLEVTNYDSYATFADRVKRIVGVKGLDTLINNAGARLAKNLDDVNPADMVDNFKLNSLTGLMLTKALLPVLKVAALQRKTLVVNMTSRLGSITMTGQGGAGIIYPTRTSRAALNMITKCLSIDLKPYSIYVIGCNPGHVRTAGGGPTAPLDVETSVAGIIKVIQSVNGQVLGQTISYDGTVVPN
ncbi:unnamed protein product [Medioppia subpectinata]|uniref:C-factor n=1 Tax=Medioppia subpectinata TaxID=1979941 RepID=A0A7R9KLV0_9ACAR|nr:unnamed protein product [Medioppia subpectinata]CAG2104766.1 unnamed protein product [Medioppia subpectinata]